MPFSFPSPSSDLKQKEPFTVTVENEARVDLVLIQPFLLYNLTHVVLKLTSIFWA